MKKKGLKKRIEDSANDFIRGVKADLESFLKIEIHPIENQEHLSVLFKRFDQVGLDAFYFDEEGLVRGLGSRINYSEWSRTRPAFTFRYAIYNWKTNSWDYEREYYRKLKAANAPEQFALFPKLHVESWSKDAGSGNIGWSFAAETKDILNYAELYINDESRVRVFEPKTKEKRKVISICIETFARDHRIIPIRSHRLSKEFIAGREQV